MNLASIDIGTNSTRMLVSSCNGSSLKTLQREMAITRLGKGMEESGCIKENNFNATIEALKSFAKKMNDYSVSKYKAVGTSALRRASNSNRFLEESIDKAGIEIEIIDAEKEAHYSYFGAVKNLSSSSKVFSDKYMVFDVGGGSSEIIYGDSARIINFFSIDIGCVRMSEKFIFSDPPSIKEKDLMHSYIKNEINKTLQEFKPALKDITAIGLAGTVSSLSGIYLNLEKYDSEKINGLFLSLNDILKIYDNLFNLDLASRKKIKGLEPQRADVILGGTAVIIELLKYFNIKNIVVSEFDILDGIIYSLIDF